MIEKLDSGRKKLAIIDGKSVFYRGYYAMPNLSTKDGIPTGGVYGFATMALEVIKRLKPDYVCVAWDKPKTNIRKRLEIYPAYKAGRKPPPPDFYEQIPVLHELLDAFGWPLYEFDDYEADDIMGTLALQATKQDVETMLITSDLDMLQLIDLHVNVYALKKGLSNIELYHPESFTEKYGILPSQFLDLKALKGDSSDNIPGVPGIGEKGALELLKDYKTLDEIYDNLALIKNTLAKKLEAGKESAYLSKKLAAIWFDAPIKLNLKEVDGTKCDPVKLLELLQKLEFRTLARQLPEIMKIPENQHSARSTSLGQADNGQLSEVKPLKTTLIDSDEKLSAVKFDEKMFIHSRCAGKHGKDPLVLILGNEKQTYTLDLKKLSTKAIGSKLSAISSIIGYDTKYSLKIFLELGLGLPDIEHDIQIGAFLINSLRREKLLSELVQSELNYGIEVEEFTTEELIERSGEIISVIKALYELQTSQIHKTPKISTLAKKVEWKVIPVLAKMEYEGIKLDTDYLGIMAEQLNDAVSDLEQLIYGYANREFNISSPSQLAEVLFVELNLPTAGIKKGKTGYSTAANELDKLRDKHEIINFITQYREVAKLKNTYVDTLPKMIDENNRVHTTFNLTVAQTGRLSSFDPNLQNIPVKTDLGRQIRTAFIAGEGRSFVSADYSQFELRLAAYLCEDENLIDMFNRDIDVHTATAAEVYGREEQDVTKNMRREAKVLNFGVMYGLSVHGLVQGTGMSYDQAKTFIDKYFEVRPKLLGYIESIKEMAKTKGYVETILGRRRPTPDVHSSNFAVREGAIRAAVNMPFQGSAADIMKLAMVKVQENFDKKIEDGRWKLATAPKILLQIHDSLIVECDDNDAEEVSKLLKETMENTYKLPVKLTVDTVTGKNWGEL